MTKELAFGGQWIEVFAAGTHTDNTGRQHELPVDFIEQVVRNFEPQVHEPPAVVGHPREDAPAYGWVSEVRRNGDVLEARFADVDKEFERMTSEGKFKKRSASFYLDASAVRGGRVPCLRHVGFLGAQPPAVKGLRPIHFSDDGATTFEISFGENAMDEKQVKELSERVSKGAWDSFVEKLSSVFGGEKEKPAASFSEADVQRIVKDALAAGTASFTEEVKQLKEANERLQSAVESQVGKTTRTEIVSFCDSLGAAKLPPAIRNAGVVEFMETLAALPSDTEKVKVVSFSDDGKGNRTETKSEQTPLAWFQNFMSGLGPFIQFGEQFGNLRAEQTDGGELVSPERREKLRSDMGIAAKEGK